MGGAFGCSKNWVWPQLCRQSGGQCYTVEMESNGSFLRWLWVVRWFEVPSGTEHCKAWPFPSFEELRPWTHHWPWPCSRSKRTFCQCGTLEEKWQLPTIWNPKFGWIWVWSCIALSPWRWNLANFGQKIGPKSPLFEARLWTVWWRHTSLWGLCLIPWKICFMLLINFLSILNRKWNLL